MNDKLKPEIENLIKLLVLDCELDQFEETVRSQWNRVSSQILSEDFIREFKDKVNWSYISNYQILSEDFIREFKDRVDWEGICCYQKLSESFMREFKDKVFLHSYTIFENQVVSESFIREFNLDCENSMLLWAHISSGQKLSEDFIREFQDKLDWGSISYFQTLSEAFIREFQDRVYWRNIICGQKLSEDFIREFQDRMNREDIFKNQVLPEGFAEGIVYPIFIQRLEELNKEVNRKTTTEEKISEMKEYAEKYSLKFDGEYLYAFRNHDIWGRGAFNKTLTYSKGNYYRDWHCDMRRYVENSFGLGIWPRGNTPVRVKVEDWGVCVSRLDGKCRVWGFEII